MMYADEFFAVVQEKQARIDLIRQGVQDIGEYLDFDNTEAIAYQTDDPQGYIDFAVARFSRMMSVMNYAAADIAAEVVAFIRQHQDDGVISPTVIEEGIAKYTDMSEFFLKYATKAEKDFAENWKKHFSRYGNSGNEFIDQDNAFMLLYGVDINR